MSRVAICTEAGPSIGLGHLARECDLAKQLIERGLDVYLVVRGQKELAQFVFERCGVQPCTIDEDQPTDDERYFHELEKVAPHVVVVDILRREKDRQYLKRHKVGGAPVVTVSDGEPPREVVSDVDIRINPNHLLQEIRRQTRTEIYAGLGYFLCNPEIAAARKEQRSYAPEAKRILVLYGGVEFATGVTRTLEGLALVKRPLDIRVVMTPLKESADQFGGVASGAAHKFTFVPKCSPAELALEIREADLQIGNASNTAYEACVLGTPQITVNMVPRQNINAAALCALGAGMNLGMWRDVRPEALAIAVQTLSGDTAWRAKLGQRGMQIVDGKGLFRVTEIIMQLSA